MAAIIDQAVAASKPKQAAPSSAPSTPSEKTTGAPKQPTTPQGHKSSAWSSLTGWVAKKLNPDATVAKEGLAMKAYFDKEKGRWVFPGEEAAVEDEAPAAPPTTMEAAQQKPEPVDEDKPYDPVAAMMSAVPTPRAHLGGGGPPGNGFAQPAGGKRSVSVPNFSVFTPRGGNAMGSGGRG